MRLTGSDGRGEHRHAEVEVLDCHAAFGVFTLAGLLELRRAEFGGELLRERVGLSDRGGACELADALRVVSATVFGDLVCVAQERSGMLHRHVDGLQGLAPIGELARQPVRVIGTIDECDVGHVRWHTKAREHGTKVESQLVVVVRDITALFGLQVRA
ncbi:hypothetical protein [Gulosibacter sediminis]|uniref:hypothetical protein n=1 Tax=Gulosibacter sediminis TaxID=1729695 RepID=UPI0018671F43